MRYGFGVDLGGTTVKLACFTEDGVLTEKWEIPTVRDNGGKQILPDIARSVLDYAKNRQIPQSDILGIGIGVPGPVDADGTVNRCVNLGWGNLCVTRELSDLTGLTVRAGNDATVAALGEYWAGGGAGYDSMVMITLGTGVGGGVILSGKAVHGAHGAGGEIGHMTLCPEETELCGCGKRGCAEQYCSATGMVRVAKRYLENTDAPCSLRDKPGFSAKDVTDAAEAGDAAAYEIAEQVYNYMGMMIANVCCVINPRAVVLGGGVSRTGKPLLDRVTAYFQKYAFHGTADTVIALAKLGNDAGVYGAFRLLSD